MSTRYAYIDEVGASEAEGPQERSLWVRDTQAYSAGEAEGPQERSLWVSDTQAYSAGEIY